MPGPPTMIVSPRAPWIRFRTPAIGGSAPERRRTSQTPSSFLMRSAETDGDRSAVPRNVQRQLLRDTDGPAEVGLEVAHLGRLEHRARAAQTLGAGVGGDDVLALDLGRRGRREVDDDVVGSLHRDGPTGAALPEVGARLIVGLHLERSALEIE